MEEFAELRPTKKQVRSEGKVVRRGLNYYIKKPFQPNTKTVNKTSEKLFEDAESTTAAVESIVEIFLLFSDVWSNT